jgi:serine/threonine-protein kinase RsbW
LRVPGAIAYRHLAIRLVSTACKMALESSEEEEAPDFEAEVVSAFGEAFNNVAVHGYRDVTPEPVQIEVDWDADKLAITMIDTGRTFDPSAVAEPDLDQLPENGMGWFIMTSCMDEIDYRPGPPNVLRLVKRRGHREGLLPPVPGSAHEGGAAGHFQAEPSADGDRGSGVEVIDAASHEASPPAVSGGSVWRMKAVRADHAAEGSRRK